MTAHAHDPVQAQPTSRTSDAASSRPRWLLPALAIGGIAAVLVLAGVVSLGTVFSVGLVGGMLVMHLGGHGHGGHGGRNRSGAGADDAADEDGKSGSHGCH